MSMCTRMFAHVYILDVQVTATPFFIFYGLFAFVLYPNRHAIHRPIPADMDERWSPTLPHDLSLIMLLETHTETHTQTQTHMLEVWVTTLSLPECMCMGSGVSVLCIDRN